MINHGSLVISLDFELMWGCHDWTTPEEYGATNIAHVPEVIDRMLVLFEKYEVHATFATVGMIMCKDKRDVLNSIPDLLPSYENEKFSPYKGTYIADIEDQNAHLYFAPDVIEKLKSTKGVEIGTHTFSHYFCWENGQTTDQFKADLESAITIAKDYGNAITSIVFPKNEVSKNYLEVCARMGIKSYRGNAQRYFSESNTTKLGFFIKRMCRLLDSYVNVGGISSIPYNGIDVADKPMNLRASRMLRPFSPKFSFLEGFRLKRITDELQYAARHNEMYHIWWHPHNFGANIEQNLAFLEKILQCYYDCHQKYNMQSYTMNEMRDVLVLNSKEII